MSDFYNYYDNDDYYGDDYYDDDYYGDYISNYMSNTIISGTSYSDDIYNGGSSVTINGGTGNDTIINNCNGSLVPYADNDGSYVLFKYNSGDGSDVIYGFRADSTLQIDEGYGAYSTQVSGDDILVTVGYETITLVGAATLPYVYIDGIYSYDYYGDDSYGDDYYSDDYYGDDSYGESIYNYMSNTIISGTSYSDDISNIGGDNVSINGGAGNDYIYNMSESVTIDGGKGNDSIVSGNSGTTYVYNNGDGNDLINWNSDDTLRIESGNLSGDPRVKGDTVIFTVGKGKISLQGAAGKSVNFWYDGVYTTCIFSGGYGDDSDDYYGDDADDYGEEDYYTWRLNGTTATYGTSTDTLIAVNGVGSIYGLYLYGTTVTISDYSLNQSNVSITNGYTLAIADDVMPPQPVAAHWSGTTYKSDSYTGGYNLVNNQIIYTAPTEATDLFTINGVQNTDNIAINGTTVTVSLSALGTNNVSVTNGYTLALANDVTAPQPKDAHWSGTVYKSASNTGGYTLTNNQIVYTAPIAETDLFTLSGVANTDGITISGTTVTVPLTALGTNNVSVTNGYTLALANGVTAPQPKDAHWSGTVYKSASNTGGYTLTNNQIVYTAPIAETDLFTISGVNNTNGITINGTVVTVPLASLGTNNVSVTNGYMLALANDVKAPQPVAAHWSGTTYKSTSNTGGYTLANNQIVYTAPIAETDLFTISGVQNTDGITINGTTVTVPMSALTNSNVSINNGYTLAIANDVTAPQTTAAHWSGTTYKSASNTAGYSLVNNQINYTAAVAETDLFTLSGVANTNGITINGTTVTIPMAALNQANVSITNGYSLALTNDVTTPQPTAAHWELKGLTATYKNMETSAGYQLINNQIIYKPKTGGEDLITINGVKSLDGILQNGTTIMLSNSALNQETVTISNGYTLATGQDVPLSETTPAGWTLSGSLATYKNSSTTAGYKLENNQLVYKTANGGETLVTVDGVKSENGLTIDTAQRIVTVAAEALNNSNVTVSAGYTLKLADNVPRSETTQAGWTLEGANTAIYRSNKTTAGYNLNANNQIIYSPESGGNTVVTVNGVKSKDGLSLNGQTVIVGTAALGTSKVTVDNGYTLKLAEGVQKPTTTAAKWTHKKTTATYKGATTTAGYTITNNVITYSAAKAASTVATINGVKETATPAVKGKVITLTKNNLSSNKVTVDGNGYEFNFAKDYKKATITGSKNADAITTNGSKVSIVGGKGNDTIKMFGTETTVKGGAGNDLFVYKAGKNNVIADYAKGDKISIVGSAQISTSGKDVVFTVGKNKLTVKDGKNKKITYTDNSGENIYNSGVTTTDTSIKLLKNYSKDSYTIANNNEIRTIDASAVLHGISLTGNKSMNLIVGGEDNDTLIGGKGNDTLTGGKGSDIFVYANGDGNDVITDYTSDDRIKITKGTAKVKKNGKDIILTFGNVGRITVKDAADKVVTYIDAKGKINYYPKPTKDSIVINSSTSITVLEEYKGDTFDVGNVKDGNKVKRIDASPVSHDLKIVGNAKANVILGGYGNDSIYGGKNNDTLQGGDGKDIFVYESGDGNDVILDYNSEDTIKITKGTAKVTTKGSDVVFTVDSGKITLQNAAGKTITYIEGDKKKTYGSSASFIEDDTDYELTPNLSSLVQSKAVDYSFLSTSNNLAKKDNLIAYSGKK